MTIQLKLDTGAMRQLFPEGSEARVELSRAVIENIIKSLDNKAISIISEVRKKNAAILEQKFGFHGYTSLTDPVKKTINTNISQQFDILVNNYINDQIKEKYALIEQSLTKNIEDIFKSKNIEEYLIKYVNKYATELINSKINAILKELGNKNENVSS